MANLSVDFAGVRFRNPLILASAAPGHDGQALRIAGEHGIGGVIPKTIGSFGEWVQHPRNGRMYVYRVGGKPVGMMDLELFTTKPIEDWLERDMACAKAGGAVMQCSILAFPNPSETAELAKKLQTTGMIDLFEINVSCPMPAKDVGQNIGTNAEKVAEQVHAVKAVANCPVVIKLTPNVTDIVAIGRAAQEAGADGITIGNSLKGFAGIDIETGKPYQRVYCGYGGPGVKPVIMRMVTELARALDIPISAAGGVSSYQDLVEYVMAGATTVQSTTAVLWNGYEIIDKILSDLNAWMDEKGYGSLDEFRGCALKYITTTEELAREDPLHAAIDKKLCVGCGKCQKVCMYRAVSKDGEQYRVDAALCDGCGMCTQFCAKQAITLVR